MAAKSKVMNKKATGVNKGLKEGMQPEQFEGRVICKKCGKDIEFTLQSELFQKCPRCGKVVERQAKDETKRAGRIIKWDILRRSKRAMLRIGAFLSVVAITYNLTGFFTGLFNKPLGNGTFWWLALLSLPLVVLAYFCMRTTYVKSASKKYKFFAWLSFSLVIIALALIVITAVPDFNKWAMEEWLKRTDHLDLPI